MKRQQAQFDGALGQLFGGRSDAWYVVDTSYYCFSRDLNHISSGSVTGIKQ